MIIVYTIGLYIKIKINLLEMKRDTFIRSYFNNYNYSILFIRVSLFYNLPMRNIFAAHEISFSQEQWYVGINCEQYRYDRKIFNKPQYRLKKKSCGAINRTLDQAKAANPDRQRAVSGKGLFCAFYYRGTSRLRHYRGK